MRKHKIDYNFGGSLQGISPLLGLIPGAGTVLSPLTAMVGGLINRQTQNSVTPMKVQQNTNPYGYQHGGKLDGPGPKKPKRGYRSASFEELQKNYKKDSDLLYLLNNIVSNDNANYKYHTKYGGAIKMQHAALGGKLDKIGPNTVEVNGNNPQQVDGVELPNAYVDHGETISTVKDYKYVFSDTLINPRTGRTFAADDKLLAKSDAKASKKMYDVEGRKTLEINKKLRHTNMQLNEKARIDKMRVSDKSYEGELIDGQTQNSYGYTKGGKLYMNNGAKYLTGYQAPWENFNISEFQKYAGLSSDNIYGPKTHQALLGDLGRQYALDQGYLWDDITKGYLNAQGYNPSSIGIPSVNMLMGLKNNPFKNYDLASNLKQINEDLASKPGEGLDTTPITTDPQVTLGTPAASVLNPQGGITSGKYTGNIFQRSEGTLPNWLGTGLQGAELLGKGLTLLRKPKTEQLYQNTSPISLRQYNPSNSLLQNQYSFNALRNILNNSVGSGAKTSNLQQAYANKYRTNADILARYSDMNKQAQDSYEAALAQRGQENIQYRMARDQMNTQNQGAYFNALRGFAGDVGNLGRAINTQSSNKQAINWLMQAFPDIARYFNI